MSAFLVIPTTVHDMEKFKLYLESAGPIIASYKGKFLIRGKVNNVIYGKHEQEFTAIIQFPDQEAINAFYNSSEYQKLIPNRDEAAAMDFISYDELT